MKNELLGALKLNEGKEVKINYEDLKNKVGYEDIFYETILKPSLDELGIVHRFAGEYIIISKKK